jgi:hypothetical protein
MSLVYVPQGGIFQTLYFLDAKPVVLALFVQAKEAWETL